MPQNRPKNPRCECQTQRGCRCTLTVMKDWSILNRKICFIHYKSSYGGYASYLQNIYRNKRKRRVIEIYRRVPDDIQRKILFYIRENDLIKKHHYEVINNILINKFNRYLSLSPLVGHWVNLIIINGVYKEENFERLLPFLDLIIKYYKVISDEFHERLVKELELIVIRILGEPYIPLIIPASILKSVLNKLILYFKIISNTSYREFYVSKITDFQRWSNSIIT